MNDKTESQSGGSGSKDAVEQTTFFTRRRLMKGTAGAVGVGALGGLGLWYGTQPSLAATTFAGDTTDGVTVTTNEGSVTDVTVAPAFNLAWENFGQGVSGLGFDIEATVGSASNTVYSDTGVSNASGTDDVDSFSASSTDLSNSSGNVDIACTRSTIVDGTGITTGDFPTNVAQGASESVTVSLSLTPSGTTTLGSSVSGSSISTSFDLTVENPDGSVTATITSVNPEGSANDSVTTTST